MSMFEELRHSYEPKIHSGVDLHSRKNQITKILASKRKLSNQKKRVFKHARKAKKNRGDFSMSRTTEVAKLRKKAQNQTKNLTNVYKEGLILWSRCAPDLLVSRFFQNNNKQTEKII